MLALVASNHCMLVTMAECELGAGPPYHLLKLSKYEEGLRP
jgi:hypothetical protein